MFGAGGAGLLAVLELGGLIDQASTTGDSLTRAEAENEAGAQTRGLLHPPLAHTSTPSAPTPAPPRAPVREMHDASTEQLGGDSL